MLRLWGGVVGPMEFVILTDSNGRGMEPGNIEAHIPRESRGWGHRSNIRVEVAYTLLMVYERLQRGALKVDGAVVILDVTTNDVRGTTAMAQVEPDEVAWRYERVVRLLKQKGAVEVVCCEVKSMRFMDVTPYSNALHSLCLRLGIPGCATQIGVSHLGQDGFHILPSCLTILDRTYACAIMGVPVPCPPPAEDRYRDPGLRRG